MRGLFLLIIISSIYPLGTDAQEVNTLNGTRQFFLTKEWRDSADRLFYRTENYKASDIAIIVVDVWDKHWCKSLNQKTATLIPKMNQVLDAARTLGIQIIFAPSETMAFYKHYPQRQRMENLKKIKPGEVNAFNPPPLPWGRTGGCECTPDRPCKEEGVWTRQNADLTIKANDLISDNVDEINTFCSLNGIKTLIYMGEASNMCVTWTRPFSVIPMIRYGYETLVVRDMVEAITGNGYDPDRRVYDSSFTPQKGADSTIKHIEKYICPTIFADQILLAAGKKPLLKTTKRTTELLEHRMFTKEFVKNYKVKGPTQSFRQLCFDYNWPDRAMINLPLKFTKADPVAYAELCKQANLDAALVLALPHPGYATYPSTVSEMFPGLKRDWFGEVVQELHKRNISALGYITLGTNWNFMRKHLGLRFIRSGMQDQGQFDGRGLCLNAPGYMDQVVRQTKELLTWYPIDGIRYDMLFTPYGCDCDGCRKLYKQLYKEDFTCWDEIRRSGDSNRYYTFNIETLRSAVQQLHDACKSVKPNVEVWQNHLDPTMSADLNTGRLFDIAYIEFGTPFRLLALKGILDKKAIIVGQTLTSSMRNLILAMGAHCYQYVKVEQETALPVGDELKWVKGDLSHFYSMVGAIQPFLENAEPVSDVGILFSENTRYRFKGFDRKPYMNICESITNAYLKKSVPVRFVNVLDLNKTSSLSRLQLLFLPLTTGLTTQELDAVKAFVKQGGKLVVMGDALMYNNEGKQFTDFPLAKEMGVTFINNLFGDSVVISTDSLRETVKDFTVTKAKFGNTLVWTTLKGAKVPLVHINNFGNGKIIYMASATSNKALIDATETYFGSPFIKVSGQKQVVLTEQPDKKRWILHLIEDGEYQIDIKKKNVGFSKIVSQYPASSRWKAVLKDKGSYWSISVTGNDADRLVVLK